MQFEIANKIIKKTEQDYQKMADQFEKTRRNLYWPEFEYFKPYFKENQDILDIGCGGGRFCKILEPYNVNYIGIDLSSELVRLAKQHSVNQKCTFETGNILDLNILGDKKYDLILIIGAFHHLPSFELRQKALNEVKKHLKPNGYILMTNWYYGLFKGFKTLLKQYFHKIFTPNKEIAGFIYNDLDFRDLFVPWKLSKQTINRYYHSFSKGELKKLFKQTGFKILNNKRFKNRNIISIIQTN